jgi:hypothetical protein
MFVPLELGCWEVSHITRSKCSMWGLSSIFLRILNFLYWFLRLIWAQNFDTRCNSAQTYFIADSLVTSGPRDKNQLRQPSQPWPPLPPMLQRPRAPTMGSAVSPQSRGGCYVNLSVRGYATCHVDAVCGDRLVSWVGLCVSRKPKGVGCCWGFTLQGGGWLGL